MPSKTTRLLLAPAVLVAAAASLLLGSASAQAADTGVTFGLAGGSLTVTAPLANAAPPTNGAAGAALDVPLGTVSVSDTRGTATTAWTASVISTAFTTGAATPTETVAAALIGYRSGALTATAGTGTTTAGGNLTDISASATAFSHGNGTGSNSLSWSPTLVVNIPLANEAGTYTGTVTHSVA